MGIPISPALWDEDCVPSAALLTTVLLLAYTPGSEGGHSPVRPHCWPLLSLGLICETQRLAV